MNRNKLKRRVSWLEKRVKQLQNTIIFQFSSYIRNYIDELVTNLHFQNLKRLRDIERIPKAGKIDIYKEPINHIDNLHGSFSEPETVYRFTYEIKASDLSLEGSKDSIYNKVLNTILDRVGL